MKCSYCDQAAQVKCACVQSYLCQSHFGPHFMAIGNHPFETAKVYPDQKQNRIKKLVAKRINDIDKSKSDIESNTKFLINFIVGLHNQALNKLDEIGKVYLGLIGKKFFFESEINLIENLDKLEISIKEIKLNEIKIEAEKVYLEDLVSYSERKKLSKINFLNHHVGGFRCGAITNDGKILVTGGQDSTIRGWDLVENKQIFILFGHNSNVQCLQLIKDSQYIISGSFDASVRIWNLQQQKQIANLKGHKCAVSAICYVDAHSLIVSADSVDKLILWDFNNHTMIKAIKLQNACLSILAMKTQFNILVGLDCVIYRIGIETPSILSILKGHSGAVWSLLLTNDEKKLISGSGDRMINIWNLTNSKIIMQINGEGGGINSIALSLDEEFFVTSSDDYSIKVWSMQTGELVDEYYDHDCYVNCVLNVNTKFLSLSADGTIGKLEIEYCDFEINSFLEHFYLGFVNFEGDSDLIGYGSGNQAVIWNSYREKYDFTGHESKVIFVEISADGKFAISGSLGSKKNLICWDLKRNQQFCRLRGHFGTVHCGAFSKDSMIVASGSSDLTVRIWDLRENLQICKFKGHTKQINSIKFIDSKNLVVSAGEDCTVRLWNLTGNPQYKVLNGHDEIIWKVVVTQDEKYVISGDLYDGIRVWNIDEKQEELAFSFEQQAENWLKENGIPIESVKRFLKA